MTNGGGGQGLKLGSAGGKFRLLVCQPFGCGGAVLLRPLLSCAASRAQLGALLEGWASHACLHLGRSEQRPCPGCFYKHLPPALVPLANTGGVRARQVCLRGHVSQPGGGVSGEAPVGGTCSAPGGGQQAQRARAQVCAWGGGGHVLDGCKWGCRFACDFMTSC
jgi:hypothetical protein